MATTQQAIGKLVITYIDTNNEEFQENPFYINGNLLQDAVQSGDDPYASINGMKNRINVAISQMDSLTTATIKSAKVVYEVDIPLGV